MWKMMWNDEWMNEWCTYIALYCILLYTQSASQSCGGGSLLNHHQCAASTWIMRRLPQDNGASALTTHQLQVERRESHWANQVYALTTHQLQVERRESHRANSVEMSSTLPVNSCREYNTHPAEQPSPEHWYTCMSVAHILSHSRLQILVQYGVFILGFLASATSLLWIIQDWEKQLHKVGDQLFSPGLLYYWAFRKLVT